MIKKYKELTNESLRDKMIPKSKDEIKADTSAVIDDLKKSEDFSYNLRKFIIKRMTNTDYPSSIELMHTFVNNIDDDAFLDAVMKTIDDYTKNE